MIYHITTQTEWEQAIKNGYYAPNAYSTEGFIHACKPEQIEGVLERHFANAKELFVLHIDENRLLVPHTFVFVEAVKDEFPHIFGHINLDAIDEVTKLTD